MRDELRGAPRTSLNVRIGQTRRYAVVRAPLEELKAIADNLGGSITDVVLAAATSGLRELLLSREDEVPPRGLRALVPVTRRDASDRLKLGNLLSFWFVDLPVGEPLAPARLRGIAAATRRRKSSDAARAASTMIDVAALTPPVVAHAALIQTVFSRRMFNVAITNVPGAPVPLYAFGLIFATDASRAFDEMIRVLGPAGRALFSVWVPAGPIDAMVSTFGRGLAAATGRRPPRFAWHDAVGRLAARHRAQVQLHEGHLRITAASPEAYLETIEQQHPVSVAGRPGLERAGRYSQVRNEALRILREGNEDPQAFRVSSPYRVVEVHRPG